PIANPQAQQNEQRNEQQKQTQDGNQNAAGNAGNQLNMSGDTGLTQPIDINDGGSSSRSSTINYEVNRIIRHIQAETGAVERVSAAVIIDYAVQPIENLEQPGAQGNAVGEAQPAKMALAPLPEARMQKIRQLVK